MTNKPLNLDLEVFEYYKYFSSICSQYSLTENELCLYINLIVFVRPPPSTWLRSSTPSSDS